VLVYQSIQPTRQSIQQIPIPSIFVPIQQSVQGIKKTLIQQPMQGIPQTLVQQRTQ